MRFKGFLSRKLPTRNEIILLFLACVIPIHIWSIINILREIPRYLQYLTIGEIIIIFAYTQAFALFESLIVTVLLILFCLVLPARFFRDWFLSQGILIVYITTIWAILYHFQVRIVQGLSPSLVTYMALIWLWAMMYFGVLFGSLILIRKKEDFEQKIISFIDRLSVLSAVYIIIDVVSIFIVLMRNID